MFSLWLWPSLHCDTYLLSLYQGISMRHEILMKCYWTWREDELNPLIHSNEKPVALALDVFIHWTFWCASQAAILVDTYTRSLALSIMFASPPHDFFCNRGIQIDHKESHIPCLLFCSLFQTHQMAHQSAPQLVFNSRSMLLNPKVMRLHSTTETKTLLIYSHPLFTDIPPVTIT